MHAFIADENAPAETEAERLRVGRLMAGMGSENDLGDDPPGHKSGYVAIIGRPNAGKSTLLNSLVGQKLSIVSPKAQTTRHRILGIMSDEDSQVLMIAN